MFKTSAQLRLENLVLRQQLTVLRRSAPKRLKLTPTDRISWVWLHRVWADWKSALMIVKAETVVAWHRKGFRLFWTWKIHRGKAGRPSVPHEVRDPRGKGPMSNGSLGPFAASVWIISSSSANVPYIVRSRRTLAITITGARTCRPARTPCDPEESRLQQTAWW
jgi:hypothetical protein